MNGSIVCCPTCPRKYSNLSNLKKHQKKCNGCLPLQCPYCMIVFSNSKLKYEHALHGKCVIPNQETARDESQGSVTVVTHNTNTINTGININTNNGTIININLAVPKDFRDTDIQLVIDAIVKNPAFMQLAHEHNLLTEAILDETHFSGALENRNVFGADKNGKYLNVMVNGQRGVINKKIGLAQSINNVNTIANSPKLRTFLTEENEKKPILPTPDSAMMQRCLMNKHEELYFMKGSYRIPATMTVPSTIPLYFTQEEIEQLMIQSLELVDVPHRQDIHLYKDLAMRICGNFKCVNGTWFKGIGEGWEVYKDPAKLQKEVYIVLNDLKNKLRDNVTKNSTKFSDQVCAKRVLDYFPDRILATQAVEWVREELGIER